MYRKFVLDNFRYDSYTTQTSYTTQRKRLRVGAKPNEKSTHIKQEKTKMSKQINYNREINYNGEIKNVNK